MLQLRRDLMQGRQQTLPDCFGTGTIGPDLNHARLVTPCRGKDGTEIKVLCQNDKIVLPSKIHDGGIGRIDRPAVVQ